MAKYTIPVHIMTHATYVIGEVECDSFEEYLEKAEALWDSEECDSPTTNCHNDFDLGDWDLDLLESTDIKHYEAANDA